MSDSCEYCLFYLPDGMTRGLCRRFPPTGNLVRIGPSFWCGEFKSFALGTGPGPDPQAPAIRIQKKPPKPKKNTSGGRKSPR